MEDLTKKNSESPKVIDEGYRSGSGLMVWVMAGIVFGLLVANGFLFWRGNQLEGQGAKMQSVTQADIASVRENNTQTAVSIQRAVEEFNQQIHETSSKADVALTRARSTAQKHAEKLVETLAAEQKASHDRQEKLAMELGNVKEATEAKVTEIVTDVGAVKGEVATTKTSLENSINELKSVRGDLGVQSGLIATNSKELAALREMGERNYYEFNVTKSNQPQKIGGIMVTLRKTDPKRNKYNVDVIADDRKVEKKDKYINEPVQFYVAGARQPFEIVVNEVQKDRIAGYLATPKVFQSRR
jgi:hypothetical protein